jgi:putative acetyltransferase
MKKLEGEEVMNDELLLRLAQDEDAEGLIALIEGCFDEYEGCVMDLDGIDDDLKAIATNFRQAGGKFWVLEDVASDKRIAASVGFSPSGSMGEGAIELKKLYVNSTYRRRGIASKLLDVILEEARALAAPAIDLWSDTRFVEAHAFYQHHGFTQLPETRELHDPSNTTEYYFVRNLGSEL